MCVDLVFKNHIVACVDGQVERIDATTFSIGGVKAEFWDALEMCVIGNKSVVNIPADLEERNQCLTNRWNEIENQIEMLKASQDEIMKLLGKNKPKEIK